MIRDKIEELANEAAHDAVHHIQTTLGVKSGDLAGLYFSGDKWDILVTILEGYISTEISEGARQP